jgi:hypothetical protein
MSWRVHDVVSIDVGRDVDLEDDGVWQVAFAPRRYSFIFIDGHYSLDDQIHHNTVKKRGSNNKHKLLY